MGIWGTLFGSENFLNKAMDGVDSVVFTPQEKAEHFLESLKHYEPFKLAQRLLMLVVCIPYVVIYLVAAGLLVGGEMEASKSLATMNNDTLGLPFALIVGFYFAGGMANGMVEKFKK